MEIINDNKALWRVLNFKEGASLEVILAALRLFDRRSGSALEEVSVKVDQVYQGTPLRLFETLQISEESLAIVSIELGSSLLKTQLALSEHLLRRFLT